MIYYKKYGQNELAKVINAKNKKIDSQRAMLYQLRVRRDLLNLKVINGQKIKKENSILKHENEKLNERIKRLLNSGGGKAWSLKEYTPVMLNAILGYYKVRKEGCVTSNEMSFLIIGYQRQFFTICDIQTFNKKWARNPSWMWRKDFRECCEAGSFYSNKIGRKTYYYLSLLGRERLESLLKHMFAGN